MSATMGPNVRKLWASFVAVTAIPPSVKDGHGLQAGVDFINGLRKGGPSHALVQKATEQTEAALAAVKAAPGNPYGNDDEAIAGAILEAVEKKKRGQLK
jgi:hypothetical protein